MATSDDLQTPPISRNSPTSESLSEKRSHGKKGSPQLSIDLTDLPALVQPSPPSNTLIVTNLKDPSIFAPTTLAHLRALIDHHTPKPDTIHAFSPLPSLARIIVSFTSTDAAIAVRGLLDGIALPSISPPSAATDSDSPAPVDSIHIDTRIRVYFGAPTPLTTHPNQQAYLRAPKAEKQFFISPPPSPPHGWEVREEGPPNREVFAEDLAKELERLRTRHAEELREMGEGGAAGQTRTILRDGRQRSGSSTILYQPPEHGDGEELPAIAVEDLTLTAEPDDVEVEGEKEDGPRKIMAQTARPPVELMADS